MDATIFDTKTGEARTLDHGEASAAVRMSGGKLSFAAPLPAGWEKEIPRYRAVFDVRPAEKARHRMEPPFSSSSDTYVWQYATEPVLAGEEISTTAWPHSSWRPLNHSATAIHTFFTTAQKSRMRVSPWRDGRVYLEDGLSFGAAQVAESDPDPSKLRSANVQGRHSASNRN